MARCVALIEYKEDLNSDVLANNTYWMSEVAKRFHSSGHGDSSEGPCFFFHNKSNLENFLKEVRSSTDSIKSVDIIEDP